MKITVVCDVLGKENNGTTIASMNLIRFLKSKGNEVKVVCADQDKTGEEGYYVVPNLSLGKLLDRYVAKAGVTLAKADECILREAITGADAVHITLPFSLGKKAVKIAKEAGIPVTASFHMQAENFTSYIKMNKLKFLNPIIYRYIYRVLYSKVDRVHYPTEFIKDVFEKSIKRKTPARVISNGVNEFVEKYEIEKPKDYKDKIVITTTGRYAREKSQDTLLKAIKYSKYKDKIQLILAGHGTKEKYYAKLAKKLPVKPVFNLYGRKEVVDLINYSDIYVHPAEIELEGIACLEAIACGKLVIVSDSKASATKSFAASEKCIFNNRKPKDLARVIDYWIENPEEKEKCEKWYLDNSTVYKQKDCLQKMEDMIKEVADGKTNAN